MPNSLLQSLERRSKSKRTLKNNFRSVLMSYNFLLPFNSEKSNLSICLFVSRFNQVDQIAWSKKNIYFDDLAMFFATIWKDILLSKLYHTRNLKYDDDLTLTCKKTKKTKIRFCFWLTRYCKQKWDEEGGGGDTLRANNNFFQLSAKCNDVTSWKVK